MAQQLFPGAPSDAGPVNATQAPGSGGDWSDVASQVAPSVVAIQVTEGESVGSQGSGVIWDEQGHIVTNHHVVVGAGENGIDVVIGNNTYPATLIGGDSATDIAVLKLEKLPDDAAPIGHADAATLEVGQEVAAIGNPLGLSGSVTTGIISAVDRPISTGGSPTKPVITNAIQTSAPLNPGNSGGALVNRNGELIGINSAIASVGGSSGGSKSGNIGIGFAIPVSLADKVAQQLIESGTVTHAFLGTSTIDGSAEFEGQQMLGAEVKSVVDDGPSAQAGLQVGDVIIALNDTDILGSHHLVGTVRTLSVDEKVTISVIRDGERIDLSATLAAAPDL